MKRRITDCSPSPELVRDSYRFLHFLLTLRSRRSMSSRMSARVFRQAPGAEGGDQTRNTGGAMRRPFSEDEKLKERLEDALRLSVISRGSSRDARKRVERKKSHKRRNTLLLLGGAGLVAIGIAPVRRRITSLFGGDAEPAAVTGRDAAARDGRGADRGRRPGQHRLQPVDAVRGVPEVHGGGRARRAARRHAPALGRHRWPASARSGTRRSSSRSPTGRSAGSRSAARRRGHGALRSRPAPRGRRSGCRCATSPRASARRSEPSPGSTSGASAATWSGSRSSSSSAARRRAPGAARCTAAR